MISDEAKRQAELEDVDIENHLAYFNNATDNIRVVKEALQRRYNKIENHRKSLR